MFKLPNSGKSASIQTKVTLTHLSSVTCFPLLSSLQLWFCFTKMLYILQNLIVYLLARTLKFMMLVILNVEIDFYTNQRKPECPTTGELLKKQKQKTTTANLPNEFLYSHKNFTYTKFIHKKSPTCYVCYMKWQRTKT